MNFTNFSNDLLVNNDDFNVSLKVNRKCSSLNNLDNL